MPIEKAESVKEFLIKRAEVLFREYQSMLQRNDGKYPPTGEFAVVKSPSLEDEKIMNDLKDFFNDESSIIPSVELGEIDTTNFGYYDSSKLKIISSTLLLLNAMRTENDIDVDEFHFITKGQASEYLQNSIDELQCNANKQTEKSRLMIKVMDSLK
jgi:hypothetical protein